MCGVWGCQATSGPSKFISLYFTAHLEHQLLFYWFTALAFIFELIRGKMRYCFVSFLTTRRDSNLIDKTQLPVRCLQVWYLCISDSYPWKHLNTVPSGVALTGDDIFTVSCPAKCWWGLCCDVWACISGIQPTDDSLALVENQLSLLRKPINGSP